MDYFPPGPITSAFMKSEAFVTGIMGPIGSGKTTAAIAKGLKVSARQPLHNGKRRSRAAIVRNTFPELRTTTMKSWHDWMPLGVGHWQNEGPPTHTVRIGELEAEIIFLALDRPEDVRKLLSLELTWAWLNECREQPKAILDGLTGRVGRYPPVRDGGCNGPQILMDTNPCDTDHWYYRLAEEGTPEGFQFLRQPGGRAPGAENLENLPTGYYERAAAGKDPDWIKVYIDGEYGFVRDGKPIYPTYNDQIHCRAFELAPRCPIRIGMDFGLTPAATISARDVRGRWRFRSEVVTEDMGATRFALELGKHLRERYADHPIESIRGDPAGDQRVQTDEQTVYQVLRAHKIMAQPAPTNDATVRRDAVANLLNRLVDGEPALLIHPDCRTLRKGMAGAYCLNRVRVVGFERYKDAPEKNQYSHVCEAMQYDVVSGGEGKAVISANPFGIHDDPRPQVADLDYPTFS